MTTMMMSASVLEVRERLAELIYDHPYCEEIDTCGCAQTVGFGQRVWADHVADMLIESALGGDPTPTPAAPTPNPDTAQPSGTLPGLPALWDALQTLAWLHAELAYRHAELDHKHTQLVAEIQAMVQQTLGSGGMDPQRLQEFRQRAVRIARIRAAQTPTV